LLLVVVCFIEQCNTGTQYSTTRLNNFSTNAVDGSKDIHDVIACTNFGGEQLSGFSEVSGILGFPIDLSHCPSAPGVVALC